MYEWNFKTLAMILNFYAYPICIHWKAWWPSGKHCGRYISISQVKRFLHRIFSKLSLAWSGLSPGVDFIALWVLLIVKWFHSFKNYVIFIILITIIIIISFSTFHIKCLIINMYAIRKGKFLYVISTCRVRSWDFTNTFLHLVYES